MKTLKTQAKQRGFFAIGIALALTALFGATTATILTLDEKEKQGIAAMQQREGPQQQVATPGTATVLERPATGIINNVTADIR